MTDQLAPAVHDVVEAVRHLRRENGKASVTDVARLLHWSRTTTHRRLRQAVDAGNLEVLGQAGYRTTDD